MKIDVEQIVVDYPGHRALDGVSVAIEAGTCTAILGPSGAGKSTLLQVVSGLVSADQGRVLFDGEDVTRMSPEQRRLGVVFQDLRLFDFMSGRDNVAFAPRVAGARDVDRLVDDALARCSAASFADRPARVLSGGERQRIALARALAMQPRALLLDEPFAALDAELRRTMRDELRSITQGLTTIVVTHDRDDAFALASRLVVVRGGEVEQAGLASELYDRPTSAFVATLLGEATLLPIEQRAGSKALVRGAWIDVIGDGAHIVVRPEALELGDGWTCDVIDARFAGSSWRVVLALGDRRVVASLGSRVSGAIRVRPKCPSPTV